MNECGQHAGLVQYSGDTCPMCRAIDLLMRSEEHLKAHIERIDEKCGEWGCSCTFPGMTACSQPIQDLASEVEVFVS